MASTRPTGPTPIPSRRRPRPSGDEEAGPTLRLGEMSHSTPISVASANEILKSIATSRSQQNKDLPHNELTKKMTDYTETFARFKGGEIVSSVTSEAGTLGGVLGEWEVAQLVSLCCDTPDEARTLIPSVEGKIEDEELRVVLDNISRLRNFT
ncbi:hypothetical protein B0A48_08853 [Cryoendolithus antarcticus]|uniref:RNA polymerase Rpb4/RPC9 core domain-containing protein n=1 Tax=Cryoendolithus antarcticus TaxID=1507870 RepID=A0A1V8T4C6_9PEZI|nr:hypothetical protein B0A48_08853 [Cryoendolithus antarcticus]OQO31999.1 hypothetical protein B0A51_00798 [Rachicladosporium sp. CCFEE 5018]